jgi:hypothetical protein
MVKPILALAAFVGVPCPPDSQLLGRVSIARSQRISLRPSLTTELPDWDRSCSTAGRRYARSKSAEAIYSCLPTAAHSRFSHRFLPLLCASLFSVSVCCLAGRTCRPYSGDFDCRLSGCIRGLRLFHGFGDCDHHGGCAASSWWCQFSVSGVCFIEARREAQKVNREAP